MKPTYQTEFSSGADLCAAHDVTVEPGEIKLIGLGYSPTHEDFKNCAAMLLMSRSSLPLKKGLMVANSVGLIDADYRDEVKLMVYNFTKDPVAVYSGERIAQLMPISKEGLAEVSSWPVKINERTGGFGSTDSYGKVADSGVYEA